eukprot:Rhum_TRINITY_DN14931_c0_g1::Rhum_TRINITY_DN14931_c0_g1_i1::g.128149::m.128149
MGMRLPRWWCAAAAVLLCGLEGAEAQWYPEPLNSKLVGYYDRASGTASQNTWHRIFVYKVAGGYRWHNSAGRKWPMTLKTPPDDRLMDATDPYGTNRVEIRYVSNDVTKAITEITGPHGEAFTRKSDVPTCETYTCTDSDLTKTPDFWDPCDKITNHKTVGVGATPYTQKACVDADCCKAYCSTFTCDGGAGFLDKASKNTILCGTGKADCTPAKCCDASCKNHMCPAGFGSKATADTIKCGANAGDCTDAKCCDATCGAHACDRG